MKICSFIPVLFLLAFQTGVSVKWLTPKSHDFGTVKGLEEQVHIFKFQNQSDEPVVIDNIRTTCGCTVPIWEEAPILPDSTSEIVVHFDAKYIGKFKKRIKVFVSNQRKAEVLEVSGEVLL